MGDPHCLFIHLVPGCRYRLTENLSVVLPEKEVFAGKEPLFPLVGKETCTDLSLEDFFAKLAQYRSLSFLEVSLTLPLHEKEISFLRKIKEKASTLVIEGNLLENGCHDELCFNRLEKLFLALQEEELRVALRLSIDCSLGQKRLLPWIQKTALFLGKGSYIFLDKSPSPSSLSSLTSFLRMTQDVLSGHLLNARASSYIPLLRPYCSSGEGPRELFDFDAFDALLIESERPFFGGIATHPSSFKLLERMIKEKKSSSSLLEEEKTLGAIPWGLRSPFMKALMRASMAKEEGSFSKEKKEDLERIWEHIKKEKNFSEKSVFPWKSSLASLLEKS